MTKPESLKISFFAKVIFVALLCILLHISLFSQENTKTSSNDNIVIVPVYKNMRLSVKVLTGFSTLEEAKALEENLKKTGLFKDAYVSFEKQMAELEIGESSIGISKMEIKKVFMLNKCTVDMNFLETPLH